MRSIDVAVKMSEPVRMAETTGVATGYGHENINPVFEERLPITWRWLIESGVEPGICVAHYDWPDDSGHVVVHLGFEIGDQSLAENDDVHMVDLPAVQVASVIHRGPLDDIADTFEAMVHWIEAGGYRIADRSRELYLEWDPENPSRSVTELQLPITSA